LRHPPQHTTTELELAREAIVLYTKQDVREKWRVLDGVCSNS